MYIATHAGLIGAAPGDDRPRTFSATRQDLMGLSVVAPNRLLGSGHPGRNQGGPADVGLIRSGNGGRSWKSVSLVGQADFHVLRAKESTVYGFDASNARLLVSADGGHEWNEQDPPAPIVDLAINPGAVSHVVASTPQGLVRSLDRGGTWRSLRDRAATLLTWPDRRALYSLDATGRVALSRNGGRDWKRAGSVGEQPAAFDSSGGDLYVALPDGTIKRSSDGGETWLVYLRP